ncbi:MAG TPA: aldose epimerase family protein [Pirellulales bacterium]|jgi:aldose 1-epimerase|nr:aldose epimerase family protein [Pirellulales bacterium]
MRVLTIALVFLTAMGRVSTHPVQAAEGKMSVNKSTFGKLPDGRQIDLYTLDNGHGVKAKIMTYGAIVTSVETPDRKGKPGEITLGFDSLDPYLAGHPYFGAIAGRVANRIAKGRFTIDGVEYKLATNNGPNHLHGGNKGFDKVVWNAEPSKSGAALKLSHVSPDGDEGYPGKLSVTVIYTLTDADELRVDYAATTDKPTPINLTNHTYWNLADGGKSDVLGHVLKLNADRYLPVDAKLIPTGELTSVRGTPMDFTSPATIGARIDEVPGDPKGYDHCFVLNQPSPGELTMAARVEERASGRVMEVYTTEPAIQLYTGNFLDGSLKSRGADYKQHHAFCLEAEHYPDSINQPRFPSTLLKPGQTYRQTTVHKFLSSSGTP